MDGKIDMIITKSIPRFARNTLDTLRYVRLLREKNVAIYFEVEKINTLVDGEFLMTILLHNRKWKILLHTLKKDLR